MDLPAKTLAPVSSPAPRARSLPVRAAIAFVLLATLVACSAADDLTDGDDGDDGEDGYASTDSALVSSGPCNGKAIDRAVKCAQAKGARVLSFYRSPADQERVRRENHCTNRCTGSAGCVRPTAGCTTSPHTACHAVDLIADGSPVSRAALRACGLAKTTAPHANHYDLVN
ncbi:MAG TPA: hypothetical protein VLT33_07590 [Labilithrix sp.]|nr:hypothetical protein [Labilithrix sp.]